MKNLSVVTATPKKDDEAAEDYSKPPAKIKRDAFLYLEPAKNTANFAQCGTCTFFVPAHALNTARSGGEPSPKDLCCLHGAKVGIEAGYSCGMYVPGRPTPADLAAHAAELRAGHPAAVTPKESGLVERKVRCEHCFFFDAKESECELFEDLTTKMSTVFDLDESVEKGACCNAQTPTEKKKSATS
jgi:Pyruvate/2-oxoacid:ferredoxin oxidoreductase delta subunit